MMNENITDYPVSTPEKASYISVDEMARMLSIARATAYQLTKIHGFPCIYIGRRIVIPLSAFNEWAEQQARKKTSFFAK